MSLLPLLFSAWWADLDRPHRLMDQNFGLGLTDDQLIIPRILDTYLASPLRTRAALDLYYRPFADLLRTAESGFSTISADKDMFKVMLDVQQFKPEEIDVKVVDKYIVVEAKHEEKKDEHGSISRQFVRKYLLPEQANADEIKSNISTDGILTIMAPLKQVEQNVNEKKIKIEFTGKPALRPAEDEKKTDEKKEEPTTQKTTENEKKDSSNVK